MVIKETDLLYLPEFGYVHPRVLIPEDKVIKLMNEKYTFEFISKQHPIYAWN
jgi:hypothetical protein